jgi:hypothetical protein
VAEVSEIPDTAMNRRMARGHELRHGHIQDAKHVTSDGKLWHRVNLCCGDPIPDAVPTWDDLT